MIEDGRTKKIVVFFFITFILFISLMAYRDSYKLDYIEGSEFEGVTDYSLIMDLRPGTYYLIFDSAGALEDQIDGGEAAVITGDIKYRFSENLGIVHSSVSFVIEIDTSETYKYEFVVPVMNITTEITFESTDISSGVIMIEENLSGLDTVSLIINIATIFAVLFGLSLFYLVYYRWRLSRKTKDKSTDFKTSESTQTKTTTVSSTQKMVELQDTKEKSIEPCLVCNQIPASDDEFCTSCGVKLHIDHSIHDHSLKGVNWENMDEIAFNIFVVDLLQKMGFSNVVNKSNSGDHGFNIEMEEIGVLDTSKIGVVCKQWLGGILAIDVVKKFESTIKSYGFTKGFIITTGKFSDEVKEYANRMKIFLIDKKKLEELVIEFMSNNSV